MFLDVMVFHDFWLVFMIIQGIFMILMAFHGFSWFSWPSKVFSWCFIVWFIVLSLRSSTMRFFCPTIRTNVFAMFLGFILMVANYRSSDAMNAMYCACPAIPILQFFIIVQRDGGGGQTHVKRNILFRKGYILGYISTNCSKGRGGGGEAGLTLI